jgi:hypothetical protein
MARLRRGLRRVGLFRMDCNLYCDSLHHPQPPRCKSFRPEALWYAGNAPFYEPIKTIEYLTDQLHDAACFLELLFRFGGEETGAHYEWDFWEAALAKDLRVAEGEEVEDGCGVGLFVGEVFFTLLDGH